MKQVLKRILDFIRYIILSALAVFLFCGSYYALSEAFPNDGDTGDGKSFHNLPQNSIDVLVLGSSHAQYSFNPGFFYQDTGLYSYVLGSACQPLTISYRMLREALKTQHPSVLMLEVFTALPLKESCEGISCYIIPSFIMTGEERYQTILSLPQEKKDLYLNPFVSTHNEWKNDEISFNRIYLSAKNRIKEVFEKPEPDIEKVSNNFGHVDTYPSFPVENYWYATREYEDVNLNLLPEDEEALNDINQLCKDNNINLILYKTPIDSLDNDNLTYLHRVWEWAERNEVPYIDFVEKSPEIGFYMCIHSSSFHSYVNGASILTGEISKYINENYQFDHVYNEGLEDKYLHAERSFIMSYLDYEYDAEKYLSRLIGYNGPILIKCNKTNKNKYLKSFLDSYYISKNGIYLFDNGELIDSSDSCVGIEYKGRNIYCDNSMMEIDGSISDNLSDFTVVVFSNDMQSYKKIETNLSKMWKKGFNWYGE